MSHPANINQGNLSATSNRAEVMSLILALETAEKVIDSLAGYPYARVYINMDSKYVVEGIMTWRFKWESNGWRTVKGTPVANQDLFEKAIKLKERIESHGKVTCHHVPKFQNQIADDLASDACEEALDLFKSRFRYSRYPY